MYIYQGKALRIGRGWTDADGVKHPTNWNNWSEEEKTAKGLVWQDDPAPYDSRFYWDADTPKAIDDVNAVDADGNPVLDEDGNQVVTRGLKWNAIQAVKNSANALLSPTDWYVTRKTETDTAIPSEVATYRQAVRTASSTIETAINNAADHAAFMALYDTPVDEDGNPTGNAPINDFPEAI